MLVCPSAPDSLTSEIEDQHVMFGLVGSCLMHAAGVVLYTVLAPSACRMAPILSAMPDIIATQLGCQKLIPQSCAALQECSHSMRMCPQLELMCSSAASSNASRAPSTSPPGHQNASRSRKVCCRAVPARERVSQEELQGRFESTATHDTDKDTNTDKESLKLDDSMKECM